MSLAPNCSGSVSLRVKARVWTVARGPIPSGLQLVLSGFLLHSLSQPSHTVLAGHHAHHALSFLWAFALAGASAWNSRPLPHRHSPSSLGSDMGSSKPLDHLHPFHSLSPPVALLMPLPCLCFVFSFHRSFHSMTHHTIYLLSLLSNIWIPSAGVSVLLADKPQAVGPMPDI